MFSNQNNNQLLGQAKKITEGKGLFGWLTKLFIGKNNLSQMNGMVNMAQDQMEYSQMQQQILMTGEMATATVLSVEDTGMTLNDNPVIKISLKVKPKVGLAFEETIKTMVSRIAIPRAHDEINVKFNPSNSKQIAIV